MAIILGVLGIEVLSALRWDKRNLVSDDGRMTPQFMDAWPWIMRPGNILILVGAGLIAYHFVFRPTLWTYLPVRVGWWVMGIGFVLRHWGWWTNSE